MPFPLVFEVTIPAEVAANPGFEGPAWPAGLETAGAGDELAGAGALEVGLLVGVTGTGVTYTTVVTSTSLEGFAKCRALTAH